MNTLFKSLQDGEELQNDQISLAATLLLDTSVATEEKVELLKALAQKGETAQEIAGFVEFFLQRANLVDFSAVTAGSPTIDVCGTGGDKLDLFNVSTTSMFVIAAGGAKVIKHGNRGITSKSGGADVLESLGIPLKPSEEQMNEALEIANVCFLFAPNHHHAFVAVADARRQLARDGVKTIFNLIGPLLNPANPSYQLVGLTDSSRLTDFSEILQRLGRKRAWVVSGTTPSGASVDELSTMGHSLVCHSGTELELAKKTIHPAELGLQLASHEELKGGDAQQNAKILTDILSGDERGAKREIVLLNAGAGLACAGLSEDLSAGIAFAEELIDSGAAKAKLNALQSVFA